MPCVCVWHGGLSELPSPSAARGCVECGVLTWGWAGPLAVCVCGTGDYQSCRHHQRLEAVWSVECGVLTWGWAGPLAVCVCVARGIIRAAVTISGSRLCGVWSVECGVLTWGWAGPLAVCVCVARGIIRAAVTISGSRLCGVWSADLGLGGTSCRVCVCGTGDYQSCRHHQRLEAVWSVE